MADFLVTEVALVGTGATQIGRSIRVANCDKVTLSCVVSVTAATLQATLALTGTNDNDRALDNAAVLPALTTGALVSAVPGTVTYAGNAITFNNLGIGTQEVVVSYSGFPKWVRPIWTFASGGGTVSVQATIGAWST